MSSSLWYRGLDCSLRSPSILMEDLDKLWPRREWISDLTKPIMSYRKNNAEELIVVFFYHLRNGVNHFAGGNCFLQDVFGGNVISPVIITLVADGF